VSGASGRARPGAGGLATDLAGTGRVADDLFLLSRNDITGKPYLHPRAAGLGLAGALLAELVLAGGIRVHAGRITAISRAAPGDEVLRAALAAIAGEPGHRPARDWLLYLAHTAPEDIAGRLARSGYLARAGSRRPWRAGRWVPVDPDAAFAPMLRVKAALDVSRPAAVQHRALAGLTAACGLRGQLQLYLPPGAYRHLPDVIGRLPPGLRDLIACTQAAVDSALLSHRV
jgi:hypothetical protein